MQVIWLACKVTVGGELSNLYHISQFNHVSTKEQIEYSQKPPMFCHTSWGEVRHTWLAGTTGDSIAKQCSIVMVYSVKKMNFFTVWITFQSQCTGFGNWGIDDIIIIKWGVFWKILLDLLKFSFKLFGWEKSHRFF